MKKRILFSILSLLILCSCADFLYSPSQNKVSDESVLASQSGMTMYMARLYSLYPIEDFRYNAGWGIPQRSSYLSCLGVEGTGEAIGTEEFCRSFSYEDEPYWRDAFVLLHDVNYMLENLPKYQDNYTEEAMNEFIGEGYFIRALVFYQMARRFGGVPLVTTTIAYPSDSDELEIARSSEEETWDQVAKDFDKAIELLPEEGSKSGYANKYVALTYKAEAMLYAGSVAKYNETVTGRLTGLGEKTNVRVIGFDSKTWQEASNRFFSQAYKAAREVMKSGRYSLYRELWEEDNKEAQYENMVQMYSDLDSPENIFVREYSYPSLSHGMDAFNSPYYWCAPLSAGSCPTLDFVEMFEGLPLYEDGTLRVTDGENNTDGNYIFYDSPMDLFKDAEPRLRANVIFPMDIFRHKVIDVRAGIYTGELPIAPLFEDYSFENAEEFYQSLPAATEEPITLHVVPDPEQNEVIDGMNVGGDCGAWYWNGLGTTTGFHLRKYLDPEKKLEDIDEYKSDQPFILMRYADVLLIAAESAVELSLAGVNSPVAGDNMLQIATEAINDIRDRAGASLLDSDLKADLESRNIVRKERRKELAFENKVKWDLRRWRVQHDEARDYFWGEYKDKSLFSKHSEYAFRGLYPFYSTEAHKYFFDAHFQGVDHHVTFEYNPIDYYFEIPGGEVAKSKVIDQQPNR